MEAPRKRALKVIGILAGIALIVVLAVLADLNLADVSTAGEHVGATVVSLVTSTGFWAAIAATATVVAAIEPLLLRHRQRNSKELIGPYEIALLEAIKMAHTYGKRGLEVTLGDPEWRSQAIARSVGGPSTTNRAEMDALSFITWLADVRRPTSDHSLTASPATTRDYWLDFWKEVGGIDGRGPDSSYIFLYTGYIVERFGYRLGQPPSEEEWQEIEEAKAKRAKAKTKLAEE